MLFSQWWCLCTKVKKNDEGISSVSSCSITNFGCVYLGNAVIRTIGKFLAVDVGYLTCQSNLFDIFFSRNEDVLGHDVTACTFLLSSDPLSFYITPFILRRSHRVPDQFHGEHTGLSSQAGKKHT